MGNHAKNKADSGFDKYGLKENKEMESIIDSAFYEILFKRCDDARGSLVPIEAERDIPFAIKRVYFITDVLPNVIRGLHAHRKLQQVMICLQGSVTVALENFVTKCKETVTLNKVNQGLYINTMVWVEMYDFQPGTVLLVLASEYYDEADYIRDYAQYQEEAKNSPI